MLFILMNMKNIPSPDVIYPNEYKTSVYVKNIVKAKNIYITMMMKMLQNLKQEISYLIIGKFCQIAKNVKFIMGPANHRISSVTTYPFHVFGGKW